MFDTLKIQFAQSPIRHTNRQYNTAMKKHISNNRLRLEPISYDDQVSHAHIVAEAERLGGAVTASRLREELHKKCKIACIARINRALDRAGWNRERNADGVIVWVKP